MSTKPIQKTIQFRHHEIRVEIRDTSEHIQRHWMQGAFYEAGARGLLNWIYDNVPRGGLYIDVGACIGNHSAFFAACMDASVIAIEPEPHNAEHLAANLRLIEEQLQSGRDGFLAAYEGAAGDQRGRWKFRRCAENKAGKNAGMIEGFGRGPDLALFELLGDETGEDRGDFRADILPLDDFLEMIQGSDTWVEDLPIRLVKIDVEGMEMEVLAGMGSILSDEHPLVSCEAKEAAQREAIDEMLKGYGYLRLDVKLNPHSPTYIWEYFE